MEHSSGFEEESYKCQNSFRAVPTQGSSLRLMYMTIIQPQATREWNTNHESEGSTTASPLLWYMPMPRTMSALAVLPFFTYQYLWHINSSRVKNYSFNFCSINFRFSLILIDSFSHPYLLCHSCVFSCVLSTKNTK